MNSSIYIVRLTWSYNSLICINMASSSSESRYPYPSTLNPASFVTVMKLCGNFDYPLWETQMLCLVESQELVGFIDGTILSPPEMMDSINGGSTVVVANEEYRLWKRSDRLVKSWILASLQEHVLATVVGLETARSVWTKLVSTFGPNSQENNIIAEATPTMAEQQGSHFIKLTTTNYYQWKEQILSNLYSQQLFGFIDGLVPNPNDDSEENKLWRGTDQRIREGILGCISEDVLPLVADLSTSKEVMIKLEQTFNAADRQGIATPTIEGDHQSAAVAPKQNDVSWYLPLYKAALVGDWETAKTFLDKDSDAATAIISGNQETLLHVTVATGKAIHFVKKLVERLPKEALVIKKSLDETPLSVASTVGNTEAAKILVEKNPSLLYISNFRGDMPLQVAANAGHWDTFSYLRSVSSDDDFAGQAGVDILAVAIGGGYFNIALDLIKRYPHLAKLEPTQKCIPPLSVIAGKSSSFQSGHRLNFLQRFIYSCIPVKFDNIFDRPKGGDLDIEHPTTDSKALTHKRVQSLGVRERLHVMLWDVIGLMVPAIKKLGEKKLAHHQAVQLVKCLCEGIRSLNDQRAYANRTYEPVTKAASLGIVEAVEGIVDILPVAFWSYNNRRHYITQLAVINRCEKVFNLVYQMNGYQQYITGLTDDIGNNILHLAGQLAPSYKLNLVSGAALQMQRELQWFKEVEKINPICVEMVNSNRETPAMVFTRDHKELVIEGEKWMKDTANSCTIAAALIITMVFASAITVPGGNNGDTGLPIFEEGGHSPTFILFAVTDAISLFTSTTSLLMFLSILTARYAEQDFLHALPKRLVLGLLTLFLSITSMIIAFSTAVYLVFGKERGWVIIALAALSCLPITSFVTLQFPLLIDVFSSTFGRGIFGKQSDRPFH